MNNKTLAGIMIALGVIVIAVVLWNRQKAVVPVNPGDNGVVCTMDAMICPDGSAVGRVPPTCAFAACPAAPATSTTSTPPASWIATTTADGVRYFYPPQLGTTYVSTVDWPPTITRQRDTTFACKLTGATTTIINGRTYCTTRQGEGAAGSTYTTYSYRFEKGDDLETLSFTLRTVQCLNYDEPKQSACQREQASFDPNALADQIAQTVTHT